MPDIDATKCYGCTARDARIAELTRELDMARLERNLAITQRDEARMDRVIERYPRSGHATRRAEAERLYPGEGMRLFPEND